MSTQKGSRDWHQDFDLDDPTYGDVFHEVADELVARCPVAHSQDGYYVISRYKDILTVLHDWRAFSSADGIIGAVRTPDQPFFKPNETDPPEHTQLRGALRRFFTATAVGRHEPGIRQIANNLIDAFIGHGTVEIVSQYADPLPAVAGFDIPSVRLPIASKLARFIVREGLEGGVDFAFSEELALDHAEIAPMMHLTPRWDIPIIPVVVNAFAPPMPSPRRCFDVGAFIGRCIER